MGGGFGQQGGLGSGMLGGDRQQFIQQLGMANDPRQLFSQQQPGTPSDTMWSNLPSLLSASQFNQPATQEMMNHAAAMWDSMQKLQAAFQKFQQGIPSMGSSPEGLL